MPNDPEVTAVLMSCRVARTVAAEWLLEPRGLAVEPIVRELVACLVKCERLLKPKVNAIRDGGL